MSHDRANLLLEPRKLWPRKFTQENAKSSEANTFVESDSFTNLTVPQKEGSKRLLAVEVGMRTTRTNFRSADDETDTQHEPFRGQFHKTNLCSLDLSVALT